MPLTKYHYHIAVAAVLVLTLLPVSQVLPADCRTDAAAMYDVFKSYRQHLNTAEHIDELKPYFSDRFNQYYWTRLEKLKNKSGYGRFLARYWDNLNMARDIVIVFDYRARCIDTSPVLELIAVLDTSTQHDDAARPPGSTVELWRITLYFIYEQKTWKINSFEYQRNEVHRDYTASDILDNFVRIR